MSTKTKIYFASDFHLGAPNHKQSLERERCIISWLDEVKKDASEIYLVGDVFDFWYEWKRAVPRGHVRILGKLAEIKVFKLISVIHSGFLISISRDMNTLSFRMFFKDIHFSSTNRLV